MSRELFPPNVTLNSATRAKIVARAQAQVGKSYVYGRTGPNSFDCSGLIVYAYAQETGWVLPHNSGMLLDFHSNPYVRQVPNTAANRKLLLPGDFAGYYQGISHIGMVQGHVGTSTMMVQATNEVRGIEKDLWINEYAVPVCLGFVLH